MPTTGGPACTARERGRASLTADIVRTAREHLARDGAAALSLRAVARDLGLASSALYRYFPDRDALLTALLVQGYDSLGAAAERAAAKPGDVPTRWLGTCRAVRTWARRRPQEWALLYGSPVPGYAPPRDTVGPAVRLAAAVAGLLREAAAAGLLLAPGTRMPALATEAVREVIGPPPDDFPDLLERAVVVLSSLVGAVSYELFGHTAGATRDNAGYFDVAVAVTAECVGLTVPLASRT